ncbi:hypothetical protein E2553_40010 [Paraburkholderia dipogonis]|uniref:Uncharacterized protein n=1 Tax=Paraburkholderia dipogonis TaxID=1211383 RepID=A0A4Y8MJL1_9BURK|nr:hypothetical protein [Paraburkholderia dipogonis]TFE37608.1 hypothetical protein E2553_40010 [Paraburkholderia dipogonis]
MNEESEMIKARLDALETVVSLMARRDPGALQAVQMALTKEYEAALQEANTPPETGFPAAVRTEFRPIRNPLAEQARVNAYEDLRLKVGGAT